MRENRKKKQIQSIHHVCVSDSTDKKKLRQEPRQQCELWKKQVCHTEEVDLFYEESEVLEVYFLPLSCFLLLFPPLLLTYVLSSLFCSAHMSEIRSKNIKLMYAIAECELVCLILDNLYGSRASTTHNKRRYILGSGRWTNS